MRSLIFSGLFLCLAFYVHAQEIIENPEKPLSHITGRVVELKEVMSIDDVGSNYFFKYPHDLKVAPDGSIFVSDREQLLQFGREGNFLWNYFKKGQGPEEMQGVSNYFFSDNHIIVFDGRLKKILWYTLGGKFIKEFRIHELPIFSTLQHFHNNIYYFMGSRMPSTKGKATVIDVQYDLISAIEGSQKVEKLRTFPVESFAITSGGSGAMASIAEMITVPYDKYLVICHTQNYLMKIYDLESNKIIRLFKREYDRVRVPKGRKVGGTIWVGGKTYGAPRDYLNDITKIFVYKDLLWVMTSTTIEKKGVLIDVFNFEGRYIDSFYLKTPGKIDPIFIGYTPMTISGGFLYMRVKNEDETYSIKKYFINLN